MKTKKLSAALLLPAAMTLSAADYTYMTESFEEAAVGAKNATVTASSKLSVM